MARQAFSAAPVVSLQSLCGAGPILVAAPHPDDETLGCGGLISLAAAQGLAVTVAVLTDGAASHPRSRLFPPPRLAEVRRAELLQALDILGDGRVQAALFGAPDGGLERCEPAAETWLAGLGAFGAVFATWPADPHPDHQAAFRIAARAAARGSARLFAYPVWGLTLGEDEDAGAPARPCRLDVRDALARKRAAVAAHRSQTGDLIGDDPEGFRLGEADLARHLGPFETFLAYD